MKILVTGLGGFLGGALGHRLLAEGHQLRTLSRRPLPEWESLGVEVQRGALEDRNSVLLACQGVEQVYHVAAKAGVWGTFAEYWNSNVEGTRNVLEACHSHGVTRLIHTSSPSSTFDGKDCLGADESKPYPEQFLNYYSETKAAAEKLVKAANGHNGLATVSLRPHLIWGPGDPHILPRVVKMADLGRLRRVGPGDNLVDITYVDNAVEAHLCAARDLSLTSPQAGKAYFISNGSPVRLWEWVDQVLRGLGRPAVQAHISTAKARLAGGFLEWLYRTLRLPGEPPMTRFVACQMGTSHYYDISASERDFGYRPVVGFEEAMERTLRHFSEVLPARPR
ncbi:MAG: NAD-dependent epimerase/dehydratase family protein [Vulcanimicrobiota bacterium]